jgi:hypothetical protein
MLEARGSVAMGSSRRGGWTAVPRSTALISIESIGGSCALAARKSVGSTPASDAKVAYQSHSAISPSYLVPRTAGGSHPPETNALPRMPPSQFDSLPPLRG